MNEHQDGTVLRRFLIVGIIVGLLVLLTTPFWLFGDDDGPAKPTPSVQPQAQSKSMCGLPDGDQEIPTTGPKAKWVLVGRTAIPTNKQIGPGAIKDGVPECFAHSPIGAVFAAMGIVAAGRNNDASKGAFQDRMLRPDGSSPGTDDGGVMQIAGFRVDHFDADHATVTLPARATTGNKAGGLASVTVDLEWARGDWRTVRVNPSSLASLAGFVEWSGA
jgi:hypothetical protein